MTKTVKKTTRSQSPHKKNGSQAEKIAGVANIEDNIIQTEREGVLNSLHLTEKANYITKEYLGTYTDNLYTCVDASNEAAHSLHDIANEVMDYYSRNVTELAELSKGAAACRSFEDALEIQSEVTQQMSNNYFAMGNKLIPMFFDYFGNTIKPLNIYFTTASKHLRKAVTQ